MPRRVLIFVNPIAGRGGARSLAEKVSERLEREGWSVELLSDLRESPANSGGSAEAAIVIGGDGSVRSVAENLAREEGTRDVPVLPIPMGTANLMGRHLGMRWTEGTLVGQVVAALREPRIRWVDAGVANGELFLLMAGVGIDARIIHELDRIRSGPITMASYAIPAAFALGWYDFPALIVDVDGRNIIRDVPAMALVGNVAEHGVGFPFLPAARSDDGLLDVCVMPCANRGEAIALFLHAAAGEHLGAEGVRSLTGKNIVIRSARKAPVQLDGEAAGYTPVEISVMGRRVPFIVLDPPSAGADGDLREDGRG